MRTNRTNQPVDYPRCEDFEVRDDGKDVMIYKKTDGDRAQMVTLSRSQMRAVYDLGKKIFESDIR